MYSIKDCNFFLIIATLGRYEEVDRLLNSLVNQTYQNFSLIIIDQNDNDILTDVISKYSDKIAIIHRKVNFKGVSKSRSHALDFVPENADIISFPDDDCVYPFNTLELVAESFNKQKFNVFAGKNVTLEEYATTVSSKGTVPLTKYNVWRKGPTYVFFYDRHVVLTTDGFDEDLGPSPKAPFLSGEDTDYSLRIMAKGKINVRDWGLEIAHPAQKINSDLDYHKCLGYSIGRMNVLKKHSYPLWFKTINVLFPLIGAVKNIFNRKKLKYFLVQFVGRL